MEHKNLGEIGSDRRRFIKIFAIEISAILAAVQLDCCKLVKRAVSEKLDRKELRKSMDVLYKKRNLARLQTSGIKVDSEQLLKITHDSLEDVEPLPVDQESIRKLARQLYNAAKLRGADALAITGAKSNIQILEEIARLCIDDGIKFSLDIHSDEIEAILLNQADENGLKALAEEKMSVYDGIRMKLEARSNPSSCVNSDLEQLKKYQELLAPLSHRLTSGNLDYCLTVVPTRDDAKLDGVNYEEYLRSFFKACDRPWDEIERAQNLLAAKLNRGEVIRITNNDGTDIVFSIKGRSFVGDTVVNNIPGSEIFTGPVKESVNGVIVAKGKFKFGKYPIMEDITLKFKNGRIYEYDARIGRDVLETIITMDDGKGEGSRFLGELAFGTNPYLDKHSVNIALAEKVGGSSHVALGSAYKNKETDNGNVSASGIHWDITTMLKGKEGRITLDNEVIQKDGMWIGEEFKVLNPLQS